MILPLPVSWIMMKMLVQCWKKFNQGPRKLLNTGESNSENVKRERSKKEQKGSRRVRKNMREPRGRKKPDDNQELSMALFQVAFLPECLVIFLEECLEWEGACLEWQECLGSMKFLVIQRFLQPCRIQKLWWPSRMWLRTQQVCQNIRATQRLWISSVNCRPNLEVKHNALLTNKAPAEGKAT